MQVVTSASAATQGSAGRTVQWEEKSHPVWTAWGPTQIRGGHVAPMPPVDMPLFSGHDLYYKVTMHGPENSQNSAFYMLVF